jgi:hypothetical protein
MTGAFLYLSASFGLPHWVMLCAFIPAIYLNRNEIAVKIQSILAGRIEFTNGLWILLGISTFVGINAIFHFNFEALVYPALLFSSGLMALGLSRNDFRWIASFAAIEAIVCMIEYSLQLPSILPWIETKGMLTDSGLLYQNRVYGISDESSNAAQKMLLGLLALPVFVNDKDQKLKIALSILIGAGLVLSFNRTVLLVTAVYLFASFVVEFGKRPLSKTKVRKLSIFLLAGLGFIFALLIVGGDKILAQFTRGTGALEMAGRSDVWIYCKDFILSNPLWGNAAEKWYFGSYHAHNSYLQIAASYGIPALFGYLLLIVTGINQGNAIRISCLLVYSFFQYGFGWAFSLFDLFLLSLILHPNSLTGHSPCLYKNT